MEGWKRDEGKLYVVTILQAGHVKSSEAGYFLPGVLQESASRSVSVSKSRSISAPRPGSKLAGTTQSRAHLRTSLHERQAGEEE